MKQKLKVILGIGLVGLVLMMVGCSGNTAGGTNGEMSAAQDTAISNSGTLHLKVNPEISIDYDETGKVTAIRGENEDGKGIIDLYPDYIGKDSGMVVKELIALIGEQGYFVEEIEGTAKKIVIELEAGSKLPGNNFLEVMAASAQSAVEEYKLNSNVEVEGDTYISLEDAKKIAFDHAGVDGSQAQFDDQEFDIDDGIPSYELEFDIKGNEYEYDIHAVTGEIIEFEQDLKEAKQETPAVSPSNTKKESGYDDSSYGKESKPAAKPAAKPTTKKATPAPKAKPAPKAAVTSSSNHTDYDDTDYSDYDDTDYDDSDYDDSDYDDSDYDDSDYDDSDYD